MTIPGALLWAAAGAATWHLIRNWWHQHGQLTYTCPVCGIWVSTESPVALAIISQEHNQLHDTETTP